MKLLPVLVLLHALPLASLAADPVDPQPATTEAAPANEGKGPAPERRATAEEARRGDRARVPPGDGAQGSAGPKDEKPCEPVKPCPIQ